MDDVLVAVVRDRGRLWSRADAAWDEGAHKLTPARLGIAGGLYLMFAADLVPLLA